MVSILVEPNMDPICPRVGVTLTGLTLGDHVVSLWRTSGGERLPVRGARSIPAVDSLYVEDYEAPLGRDITYELEVLSGPDAGVQGVVGGTLLPSDVGYIQDPLIPSSAVPVAHYGRADGRAVLRSSTFSKLSYQAGISSFNVMGDPNPVSIGGMRRAASGIPLALFTEAETENVRLRDLIRGSSHLVIRPHPSWGNFLPSTGVYSAPMVEESPTGAPYGDALTLWDLTVDTARPTSARVMVALWRYQDVMPIFATYDQKQAAAGDGTYLDDQKNPTNI